MDNVLKIYAKGSVRSVRVTSGVYAVLLTYKDREKMISGRNFDTTMNELELFAVLEGLKMLTKSGKTKSLTIITESRYVEQGINKHIKVWSQNGWESAKGLDIKNKELWQEIWEDYLRINPMIKAKIGTHSKVKELITYERKSAELSGIDV